MSPPQKNCPSPGGDPSQHLIHGSLGQPESTPKMASRSVSHFSMAHRILSLYLYLNEVWLVPSKLPISLWGSRSPPYTWFHGPTQVPQPKRHLDRFSCFCMAQSYVQQTDTWTDRRHYICSERPHPCTLCIRCSLKLLKSRGWLLSLVDFFSPHRMQSAKMRSLATDVACYVCRVCLYVCLSVGHNSEPYRNW